MIATNMYSNFGDFRYSPLKDNLRIYLKITHDRMLFVYDIYGLDYECAAVNVQLACARSV